MIDQQEKISEFIENDTWTLVVLDACRYDYAKDYLDVEPVRSPALNTPQWIQRTWTDYYDASYISGTPWIRKAYNCNEHFASVVDVWSFGWEDNTVPPGNMVKAVEQNLADKMIVHIMQPHMPYLTATGVEQRDLGKGPRVKDVAKQVGDERLRELYRDNLGLAINDGLTPLLNILEDRPIAVTADHGELLGEDGYYGHNEPDHEILRKVPWREYQCG